MSKDLRKEKGIKTKELILMTTLEILFQEGKAGFTTRRLIEKAGVSKGNIYHHFKNMDAVLEEALKYHIKKTFKEILNFEYHDLQSLIENIVINILTIFKREEDKYDIGHDPFLELISSCKNLHIIKDMEAELKIWLHEAIKSFINRELSNELGIYFSNVMSLFIEGARSNIFLLKKDITSYIETWKELSKHLVKKILEEKNENR